MIDTEHIQKWNDIYAYLWLGVIWHWKITFVNENYFWIWSYPFDIPIKKDSDYVNRLFYTEEAVKDFIEKWLPKELESLKEKRDFFREWLDSTESSIDYIEWILKNKKNNG